MKTKLIALLLALTMLFSFAACSDSPETPDETNGANNETEANGTETEAPVDERSYLEIALDNYSGVDLEKTEFKILSPSPGNHFYGNSGTEENEIFYEEPSDSALPNAIYNRNLQVSEALGIEIVPVWGVAPADITNIVRTNDAAGDKEYYDVILNRLDYEVTYATNGFLLNFFDIASMDLENDWWDRQIVDTFTIYDNYLFTLSGDINYYDDYAVQITFFNKGLVAENGFDDPYQLVRDGNWTLDKMVEMSEVARFDFNGDGNFVLGTDVIGIADNPDYVLHYIYCYGLRMSENDADGIPQVVWPNDQNTGAIDDLWTYLSDPGVVVADQWSGASAFIQDTVLFYSEMLGMIPQFREMESDFGILPMAKGDASQERYMAYVSNGWTTAYAIPSVFTPDEAYETGIILECLSAASKDLVTPALYDQLLESKYIRDEESKEMLSYILNSKIYDWAGDLDWASSLRSAYQNVRTNGTASFTTALEASKKQLNKQLEKLVENLIGE